MKPYYEDSASGIVIYHGDCREVMPTIENGSVDLFFFSPPYNLGVSSGGGFPNKERLGNYSTDAPMGKRGGQGKWKNAKLANGYDDYDDAMQPAKYADWQRSVLSECFGKLNETGAIYYQHKPRLQNGLVVLPTEYNPGLPLRQIIIWARAGGINFSPTHYLPTHEWILVLAKPDFRLKNKGASGVGDVWYVPQELNNPHPAAFPIALPARAIETTGCKLIVDPFCGSGTTLRAAKDAGIAAIGIERNEAYCEMAASRLAQGVLFGADFPLAKH